MYYLLRTLKVLIIFRVVVATIFLGLLLSLRSIKDFPGLYQYLNIWIVAVFFLTITYSLSLKYIRFDEKPIRIFAYFQLIVDIILVEALILLTGGIDSWFSFLLILVTISGSIVIGKRTGYILSTAGSILYGLTIDLQYYGIIPVVYNPALGVNDFFYNIFINITGLYLTAYLMGYLVSRLEMTSDSLDKKDFHLRELSRFHFEVIENIPSGLFTTDISGGVIFFNKAAERIIGLARNSVISHFISDIFPFLSSPPEIGKHHGKILRDSETRYIDMSISVNQSSDGVNLGFVGIFEDITSIKKMEEEIKRKERLSAIGELSASIAHELRNPLASMKSSFEMLNEGFLSDEKKKRLMKIAITEMDRLNRIVTDFLIYTNPRPPETKRFNLSKVAGEVSDMVQNANHKVKLTKDIKNNLYIEADEQKIRQLIWNLVLNAVDAVSERGVIKISAYYKNDFVVMKVRDTGIGIPDKDIEKIFYPFFSTKKEGTGLGLSVAYRIVEEHNGNIEASSEQSEGTEFTITLPLKQRDNLSSDLYIKGKGLI